MRLFPKRRWLRFSIRTLLVAVTVFCVWLGWQWRIVQERMAVKELVLSCGGTMDNYRVPDLLDPDEPLPPHIPWVRRAMGDEGYWNINYKQLSKAELQRVVSAYPEAERIREYSDPFAEGDPIP